MLLFDKHSTHIDLEISKFCREKGILLYCLPTHSSHITQPLDVGFESTSNSTNGSDNEFDDCVCSIV